MKRSKKTNAFILQYTFYFNKNVDVVFSVYDVFYE